MFIIWLKKQMIGLLTQGLSEALKPFLKYVISFIVGFILGTQIKFANKM